MKKPAKTGRKQAKDTRFKPGQSGNPAGRPQGSRHKATMAVQELLDGQAEQLTQKCIEKALEGDMTALRICLDRLVPIVKERPVKLKLPVTDNAVGLDKANEVVVKAVSAGEITLSEAAVLSNILKERRTALETQEFERRLSLLEENLK